MLLAGCGGSSGDRAQPPPHGALRFDTAPGGCIAHPSFDDGSSCPKIGRAMHQVHHVALSPDGRNLYSAAGAPTPPHDNGSLAVFARNTRTGGLRQLPGTTGCFKRENPDDDGPEGCAHGREMWGERTVIVSRDGRFVYGSGWNGIQLYRRDQSTGALTQLPGRSGCLSEDPTDVCRRMRASRMVEDLEFSPDGRFAYAVSSTDNSVAILRRSPQTGLMRQLPGRAGCIAQTGRKSVARFGCTPGRGLGTARGLTLSRDGRFVYVAAIDDSLAIFRRDPKTGELHQLPGGAGCLTESPHKGCTVTRALYGSHLLLMSPDERFAYVAGKRGAGKGSAITVFARDRRTGTLRQLPGREGCVSTIKRPDCQSGRGVLGAHQALPSPDGRTLYVPTDPDDGGASVWRMNPRDGHIRQLPGRWGCVDSIKANANGCANAPRAGGLHFFVISPDHRFLYAAGEGSRAIVVFSIVGGG